MNNLEVLQLHISKPFEPLYQAAVLEWASKEARKDNESRPTAGLGFFKDKICTLVAGPPTSWQAWP
jgi:hypothetical protein